MNLRKALMNARQLRENELEDEKYANGLYDYAIETFYNYLQFLKNYGNSNAVSKLNEVDDEVIETIYFILDEVLDIVIEEEIRL